MNAKQHRQRGYTLTELLIVLAIIAMLSGIAIPAVIKIGGFMSKKSDAAARDLYGVLRAARISAISYRKDTAVVYLVSTHPDNYNGAQSYVIDGYGTAVRATKAQYATITSDTRYENLRDDEVFVLAQDPQAKFREMPRDTAVIGHLTAQEEQTLAAQEELAFGERRYWDRPPQSIVEFKNGIDDVSDRAHLYDGLQSRGMRVVYLFHIAEGSDNLEPLDTLSSLTMDTSATPLNNAFPAHVFMPTGELGVPGNSLAPWKERITIAVGPAPDAPKEDRFTETTEETGQAVMAAPVRIEVYRSTGRVQIAS